MKVGSVLRLGKKKYVVTAIMVDAAGQPIDYTLAKVTA